MSDLVLMFGGGAMAFVVIVTLLVVFFTTRRQGVRRAAIPRATEVIGRRKARPPVPPSDAPYALDVLRIRVPAVELDGGVGKRDAMSILLMTEYYAMIKKMGASRSSSTP